MTPAQTRTIEEVTDTLIDYRGKTPAKTKSGIKLITAKVIKDGRILDGEHEYIPENVYNSWMRRGLPRQHDILVTTEAPLGEVAILRASEKIALAQRVILLRGKPSIIDQKYYFYAIRSPFVQTELKARSSGTTVLGIKQSELRQVRIPYHDLLVQRKIASILSPHDDLIENNAQRIKILEDMAQTIYREWFVYYRFPGHENGKLVNSPLGKMPEGWNVREMKEVAEVIDCLHSKKPTAVTDGTGILLQLFNIADGGKIDLSKKYLISESDYELWTRRIEVSEGDCIVTNVGRIAAVAQIPSGIRAALGRNITAIRPKPGILTPTFLIEYLLSPIMRSEVERKKDAGTVMDSLNVKGIVRLAVPIPPFELMTTFEQITRPLRRLIELLVEQNAHLRRTRDLLLPKLISGDVDVSDLDIRERDSVQ